MSEMTCYVSSGTLNPTHSLNHPSWAKTSTSDTDEILSVLSVLVVSTSLFPLHCYTGLVIKIDSVQCLVLIVTAGQSYLYVLQDLFNTTF